MNRLYQNKKEKILKFLANWIDQIISQKLWKKFVDLHIDEVDANFKKKENWVFGSIFVLDCILSLLDKSQYDVILAVPLSCLPKPVKNKFNSLQELETELDLTPPSFYIFPKGEENYEQTIQLSTYLNDLSKHANIKAYYNEKLDHGELYRVLYLKR